MKVISKVRAKLVAEEGVEPSRPVKNAGFLSLVRLPVPPFRHE